MYMKNSIRFAAVATLFLSLAGGVSAQTSAYSAPTGAPPTANVAAPINVGPASQTKTGLLRVNGGFYNAGTSVFERRVEIGIDPCYGVGPGGCVLDGGGGAAGASAPSSFIDRLASALVPKSAMAIGTPTTDILHVYGNASVVGALTVNGSNVCLQSGVNCGASSGQWTTSGANIYRGTGNVGIGFNTAPTSKLEIRDTAAQLILGQNATNRWKLWGGGNLHFRKNDDTDILFLGSDGRVGIGTTSPSAKLNVIGDARIGHVELMENQGGSLELGAGGGSTTPFIDFRGNGGTSSDYNARIINDANGQLSFQNGGGTKMKVVDTSQSVIVTNSPAVYMITSSSCNAVGPNPSSSGMIYMSAGTMQRGTLTMYPYCEISGSYPMQQLVGYLLPPPPAGGGGGGAGYSVGSIGVATGTVTGPSTRERQISIGISGATPGSHTVKSLSVTNAAGGASIFSGTLDNGAGAVYKYVNMGCSTTGTLKFNINVTLTHPTHGTTTRSLLYTSNC